MASKIRRRDAGDPARDHDEPPRVQVIRSSAHPGNDSLTDTLSLPKPQQLILGIFFVTVAFGTGYSLLYSSPELIDFRTRMPSAPRSASATVRSVFGAAVPDPLDSYFANKRNVFNQWFVKKAWGWTTLAFLAVVGSNVVAKLTEGEGQQGKVKGKGASATEGNDDDAEEIKDALNPLSTTPIPTSSGAGDLVVKPLLRYALATIVWLLFTTWFFGPSFSNRIMVLSGGVCVPNSISHDPTSASALEGGVKAVDVLDDSYCGDGLKVAGLNQQGGGLLHSRPRWKGGHDISGHTFLLTHASIFLLSTISLTLPTLIPSLSTFFPSSSRSDRRFERLTTAQKVSTSFALALVGLWWWMALMTSLFFHTPQEKVTGFLVAVVGAVVQGLVDKI